MKEIWIPTAYRSAQLTRVPENRYSGSTPMPGIDQIDAKPPVRTQAVRPTQRGEIPRPMQSDMSRFTGNVTTIQNPDARKFATQVRANDLSQVDTAVLRDQYAKLDLLRANADIDPNSSAQLLPYGAALVQELHRRNEDPWMMQQSVSQVENPQKMNPGTSLKVEGGDLKSLARGLGSERITDTNVRRALGGVLAHPSPDKNYLLNRLRDVKSIEPGYKPREYKDDGSENPYYREQLAEYEDMLRQQQYASRVLEQMIDVAPEVLTVDPISRVGGEDEDEPAPTDEVLRLKDGVKRAVDMAKKANEVGRTAKEKEDMASLALDILEREAFEPWASRLTDYSYRNQVTLAYKLLSDEIGLKKDEKGNPTGSKNPEIEYLMNLGLEYLLERFNSKSDIDPFGATASHNYVEEQNIDTIMQFARQFGEQRNDRELKLYNYLYNLRGKRATIHDIFKNMKSRRAYVEGITQGLSKRGLRFIEEEIVGVSDGQRWFERVLADITAHKSKWINESDFTNARNQVQTLISGDTDLKMDLNKLAVGKDNPEFKVGLRKWQRDRAALVSWMMGDVSQRNLTYICMGDMPDSGDPDRWHSVRAEELVRLLGELKFMAQRFLVQAPCQAMVDETVKLRMKDNIYGLHTEKGAQTKGLYGKKTESHAVLDDNIQDIKSASGWRMKDLFLRSSTYRTVNHHGSMSFADFMDMEETHAHHAAEAQRPKEFQGNKKDGTIEKRRYVHNFEHAKTNEIMNAKIRKEISEQRLFLGVILQAYGGNLDAQNKYAIWQTAAKLLPSRMAAFLPKDTLDVVAGAYGLGHLHHPDGGHELEGEQKEMYEKAIRKWDVLKAKLWKVEEARIRSDTEAFKRNAALQEAYDKQMDAYLKGEPNATKPADLHLETPKEELSEFYRFTNLDDNDKKAIQGLIEMGQKNIATDAKGDSVANPNDAAGGLSKIKFMYTPWLDDVPATEYGRLQDNDLERLVVGDHSDADEGWKKVMFGIYANPAINGEKFASTMVDASHKLHGPWGVMDTQKYMAYPIEAWMNLAAQNAPAYVVGAFMKFFRQPQSRIEEYNLQANINLDPDEQKSLYTFLAQHEVINDDAGEANKEKGPLGNTIYYTTMQERIRKRKLLEKSAANAAWILINLFGVGVAIEFLKVASPEFSKSFGIK